MSPTFPPSQSWLVELLTEWAGDVAYGLASALDDDWETPQTSEEQQALQDALARLEREHPSEHAAVVDEFLSRARQPGRPTTAARIQNLKRGLDRLEAWVDEAMGD